MKTLRLQLLVVKFMMGVRFIFSQIYDGCPVYLENDQSNKKSSEFDDDDETETKDTLEQINETRHILFKKRNLGSLGDDTISLSA